MEFSKRCIKVSRNYDELVIVVLNYCNYIMTIECVDKLLANNFKYKIVIVDNNSSNNSFEVLTEKYDNSELVKVIKNNENLGYAAGNNIGINYAYKHYKNDYICIMNPDILIEDKNIFVDLLRKLKKYQLKGITALQISNNNFDYSTLGWKCPTIKDILVLNSNLISKLRSPLKYKSLKMINVADAIAEVDVMPGCFFILEYNALREIGFFDEGTFLYYEENILSYKAIQKNHKYGISLNNYYIHNHLQKEESLISIKSKFKDRKILLNSQRYYVKNILKSNTISYTIYKLTCIYNIYFEMPILHLIKKIIRSISR